MPEALDRTRRLIEDELHELEAQAKRLRDVLTHLGREDGRKPARTPARRTGKRAPRGQRQRQLLASIEKHPDFKPSEHAKAIKASPNQVYGLATKLQKEGKVTKTAKGTYKVKQPKAKAKST
jgi:hypothetical protein